MLIKGKGKHVKIFKEDLCHLGNKGDQLGPGEEQADSGTKHFLFVMDKLVFQT